MCSVAQENSWLPIGVREDLQHNASWPERAYGRVTKAECILLGNFGWDRKHAGLSERRVTTTANGSSWFAKVHQTALLRVHRVRRAALISHKRGLVGILGFRFGLLGVTRFLLCNYVFLGT